MNKENNYFYPPLPTQIKNKWSIAKTLTSSDNSQLYIIKSNNSSANQENTRILKIISKESFNKNIYKKIVSIKSKHILKPLEIISFKQNYYIITEYHDNLRERICHNGISGSDILNMAYDICTALKQLHSKKILHLDCTPANIYLNTDSSYCLGDFSSAVLSTNKSEATTATTLGYIPPEVSGGLSPSILSDVYIFSCLLYTLFNNGYTITDNNPDSNIKDNIPPELYSVIVKGCSKNPSDRYSSVDEMQSELNTKVISENLSSYSYYLNITDSTHPLHYLKTPLIDNTSNNNKKQAKSSLGSGILYVALILITGSIFLFSLYNYYRNNNDITSSDTEALATATVTPVSLPTHIVTHTPAPILTRTPTPVPEPTNHCITELDLSNKNLKSLPNPQGANFSCDKLTYLYADNNKIVDISGIEYYTSLKELYLSDNLITNLLPLEETANLKILVLSYNKITDLLPICSLTSLINLDISGNNKMHNFSELISLYNLKTLNLTNTNVTREEIDFLTYYLPDCEIVY